MWRSNYYNEDWERRKTYLIRSLFQDIPLLSPVPEDQESRYGAGSPSDVPPSRPYSPLPPLIIERMPNKHDHPQKFYQDLERKVKKVYKKLFFDEDNSSVEDLIERYAGNFVASSFSDEYDGEHCVENDGALNASVCTVKLYDNRSQGQISFEKNSPEQTRSAENVNRIHSVRSSNPSSNADSSTSLQPSDVQSSTQSLCETQVVTVVEVHKELSYHDETSESIQCDELRSPVLEYHQIAYNKTSAQIEMCQEEQVDEEQEVCSFNDICRTETSGSPNKEDSINGKGEKSDEIWSSETSHKSIEVMRRQNVISPSLSLKDDAMSPNCSRESSTCTNVELQKNISLDLPEEIISSDDQQSSSQATISRASIDFQNMLTTTSTPKLMVRSKTKCFTESNGSCKRGRKESFDSDSNSNMITKKRRKYENIAIQTSFKSESEVDDSSGWNQHKINFFIGSPKIFKLCSCTDHDCRNN